MGESIGKRPVWAILLARDIKLAIDFYRLATGWRFVLLPDLPNQCWIAVSEDDERIAVFVDTSSSDFPDAPELWLPYFTVSDLDSRVEQAERLGATILRAPFDIAGFGRIAMLRQPGGGIVGWWRPLATS